MTIAFHHLFVFTEKNAPIVDELRQLGFVEGSRNRHPGQGTANRRIFFENGMLEFIWIENEGEITSSTTERTRLWERGHSETTGYSPFGIALCRQADKEPVQPPFSGWPYKPIYMPHDYVIWMANQDNYPWEPGIFYLDFCIPIESPTNEPTRHENGAKTISGIVVTIKTPINELSPAANCLSGANVSLMNGTRPFVEITLSADKNSVLDLTPCPIKFIFKER